MNSNLLSSPRVVVPGPRPSSSRTLHAEADDWIVLSALVYDVIGDRVTVVSAYVGTSRLGL